MLVKDLLDELLEGCFVFASVQWVGRDFGLEDEDGVVFFAFGGVDCREYEC